jgi:predicted nucleic acid-binding protein
MIFVDTGAWYASLVTDDANHNAAAAWLALNSAPLCTSDYVIDETLTLLRVKGRSHLAIEFGIDLFGGSLAEIIIVSQDDIQNAWNTFREFNDKQWSFTDCTSKVIIERLQIAASFSFDRHFRQFGTVRVVP